jgi:hypothetical protein
MSSWWRLRSPIWYLVVGACGGFIGILVSDNLTEYRSVFTKRWNGNVVTYRKVEPKLWTAGSVDRYLSIHPTVDARWFAAVREQLENGSGGLLSIEHTYPLARYDLRDVPEGTKDTLKDAKVPSELRITVTGRTLASTVEHVKLAEDFVDETITHVLLFDYVQDARIGSQIDRAKAENDVALWQTKIQSVERRMAELERIRDKHATAAISDEVLTLSDENAQTGSCRGCRYLSPVRQLIGAESERAELVESLRLAKLKVVHFKAMERYGDALAKRFAAPESGPSLMKHAIELLDVLNEEGEHSAAEAAEVARVRSLVRSDLTAIQSASEYQPFEGSPPVRRHRPSGLISGFVGFLLAAFLWRGLVLFAPHVLRSRP